ncbi:MAG: hypothetical protein RR313_11155 [Anaerovoracaceae bacterium]
MNRKVIDKYFNIAKNASRISDFPRQHLGAVIMQGGTTISVGYNTTKENPIQKHYNKYRSDEVFQRNSLHAEMMAIVKLKGIDECVDWRKRTLFVYRESKDGISALARPCPACRKALLDYGITSIYYTTKPKEGTFSYHFEKLTENA